MPKDATLDRCRTIRKERSFLDLHPFDAYAYVLHLLGRSDPKFAFHSDATLLFYYPAAEGPLPLEKAEQVVGVLARQAAHYDGQTPVPKATAREVLRAKRGVLEYADFLYCVAFCDRVVAARAFFEVVRREPLLNGRRCVLGRHAYAAVQMLVRLRRGECEMDAALQVAKKRPAAAGCHVLVGASTSHVL